MSRRPVKSSSLNAVGYDGHELVLEVEFKSGRVYRYYGVPSDMFDELLSAASIGTFFNEQVRSRFPFTRH